MNRIDLNADLGEGAGNDNEILSFVSSANIACGLHAGSPSIMRDTIVTALERGVSIGAHPGYPDRENFGRNYIPMPARDIVALLVYQYGALNAMVNAEGGKITYIKAHGALYNRASSDRNIAEAVVKAAMIIDKNLIIYGMPGSYLEKEAIKFSMNFASEAFADRGYNPDGSLVARSEKGAIIEDIDECIERTLLMIRSGYVHSVSGSKIEMKPDTICLHGDNVRAVEFAGSLSDALTENGILIKPVEI